jgi:lipooligosaccharide transport system ATP-binding protein
MAHTEAEKVPEAVVRTRGLVKHYRRLAVVRGVDLTVQPGECFGLLGPNGAGKSTTLRMILGLSPVTGGELRVLGRPMPDAARTVRARIGVVPQEDNLDPDLTVRNNLRVYARYFGLRDAAVERRLDELLAFFQLDAKADAMIDTLSGGMKRRLTIARALVNDPELVTLDEPTTGLDPQARRYVWERLRALRAEGRTLLLTTHYMEEAEQLCDRLAILEHGRVVTEGAPADLIAAHVPAQVVQVPGFHGDPEAVAPGAENEVAGDTLYCYTDDEQPVLERLRAAGYVTYFHRPANLEDVFLRLTGHELEEG